MTVALDSVRADLVGLVGVSQVVTDVAGCAAFAVDGKVPESAVAPPTSERVAAILRYAAEHDLAVIPRGSGTKLSHGDVPQRYDLSLSLRELNDVTHYEPADLTISVQAGMTVGDFQDLVGQNGLWLPLDPRGGAQATIGGVIAANAAGPLRQAFGGPRDMVLGLKIATTDGKVVKTGGRVVKNVAGYDFCKLLTGSFGTLGVITEASLKLFPQPPERATFVLGAGTLGIARDLRRSILRSPVDPLRLVLLDARATVVLNDLAEATAAPQPELWIELGGSNRVIERCMLELRRLTSAVGASLARREEPEDAWSRISNLALWLQQKYHDVTVLKAAQPLTATEEFLSRAQQEAEAEHIALAGFAQVGVGIVHLCALQETLSAGLVAWVNRLRQAAAELGGTLVIEHCPVGLKSQVNVWGACGDDLAAMRKMKIAWDPKGTLSPGRFLGF